MTLDSVLGAVLVIAGLVLLGVAGLVVWLIVMAARGRVSVVVTPPEPTEPLEVWAEREGWTHLGTHRTVGRGWSGWPFRETQSWEATDLWIGPWHGRRSLTFRYRGEGDEGPRHVTAIELPAALPFVELTPHGGGRVVVLRTDVAVRDLDLESAAFNRRWRVATSDPRFAHALLHPRLMERLLAPDAEYLSVAVDGGHLVCWSDDTPHSAGVLRHLAVLNAVADSVLDFVWREHGERAPGTPSG